MTAIELEACDDSSTTSVRVRLFQVPKLGGNGVELASAATPLAGPVGCTAVTGNATVLHTIDNFDGQATPPAAVFTQVAAGGNHTCGVRSDGTVACWGRNDLGQATPPAGAFTQVAAGNFHTCGVGSDGTAACWGSNADGRATPPPFFP